MQYLSKCFQLFSTSDPEKVNLSGPKGTEGNLIIFVGFPVYLISEGKTGIFTQILHLKKNNTIP